MLVFLLFGEVVRVVDIADYVLLIEGFVVLEEGRGCDAHFEDFLELLFLLTNSHDNNYNRINLYE